VAFLEAGAFEAGFFADGFKLFDESQFDGVA